ncbi:hypothetical protein LGQ02_10050 [Bacillus shivajii]|uniref:hypothetical protein n=1 Tax=Bacillus shivajii TaxID=1983719 RepID=UPI001CFA53DB|nr:hypothetical protein [Bacillus shivajii]UCZ55035.1 hypothetical protein LGQ02_10050 [Bacillus shivajii]
MHELIQNNKEWQQRLKALMNEHNLERFMPLKHCTMLKLQTGGGSESTAYLISRSDLTL